jgi:hypothetical protein
MSPQPPDPAPGTGPLGDDPRSWPLAYRWLLFALRTSIVLLCAWIAVRLPLPIVQDWLPLRNVVVAGVSILLIGKGLYDTLFYDRFWP